MHLQPLYHSLLQSSPPHLPPYPEPFWQGRLPCSSRPPLSQLETNVHKRFAVSGADKSGVVCFSRRNWRLQQLGATDTFIRPRAPCQTNAPVHGGCWEAKHDKTANGERNRRVHALLTTTTCSSGFGDPLPYPAPFPLPPPPSSYPHHHPPLFQAVSLSGTAFHPSRLAFRHLLPSKPSRFPVPPSILAVSLSGPSFHTSRLAFRHLLSPKPSRFPAPPSTQAVSFSGTFLHPSCLAFRHLPSKPFRFPAPPSSQAVSLSGSSFHPSRLGFRHLLPNSETTGYATEGALLIA